MVLHLKNIAKTFELFKIIGFHEFAIKVADYPVGVRIRSVRIVASITDYDQIQSTRIVQRQIVVEHSGLHQDAECGLHKTSIAF